MNRGEFIKRAGPALLEGWPNAAANAFSHISQVLLEQGFVPGVTLAGITSRERDALGRYVCALVDDLTLGESFTVYLALTLDWEKGADLRVMVSRSNLGIPDEALQDVMTESLATVPLATTRINWEAVELPEAKTQMKVWLKEVFSAEFDSQIAAAWSTLGAALDRALAP